MRAHEFTLENDDEHRAQLQKTGFWGKRGAGCIILATDTGRICLPHRSQYVEQPGTWGTWGGAIDGDENPEVAAAREVREEAGYSGQLRMVPLFVFKHSSGFTYYNYLAVVEREFKPQLNWETQDYRWVEWGDWPEPLHNGLKLLLQDPASVSAIEKMLQPRDTMNEDTLNEGATDVLYHYTRVPGAAKILDSGKFYLSSSTGNSVEEKYAPPGKPFFLSTTRSKVGDYHRWTGSTGVMFNLDGRWLEQRYTVKPMDYWYSGKSPETLKRGEWKTIDREYKRSAWDHPGSERTSESEDRVFSSKNTIPITPVTGVHIFYNEQDPDILTGPRGHELHQIISQCKAYGIPVYAYKSLEHWKTQNIRRSVDVDTVLQMTASAQPPENQRKPYTFMDSWIELIKKGKLADLSADANKLRYNIQWYGDQINVLRNDLHNSAKPSSGDYENAVFVNRFMKYNRLRDVGQLYAYLKDKWARIYDSEQPKS